MRSDQENALVNLLDVVKGSWEAGEVVPEHSPVGESQGHGAVERAIQTLEAQVRTIKCALEARMQQAVPEDHAMQHWIVDFAAWTERRCRVGEDGATPYERIKSKKSSRPCCGFGGDSMLPSASGLIRVRTRSSPSPGLGLRGVPFTCSMASALHLSCSGCRRMDQALIMWPSSSTMISLLLSRAPRKTP